MGRSMRRVAENPILEPLISFTLKGQFGEVFKAILYKGTPGEVLVAVKTTKTNSTEKDKADFMKEMAVMSQILHPNIVRFYGLVNESEFLSAVYVLYISV